MYINLYDSSTQLKHWMAKLDSQMASYSSYCKTNQWKHKWFRHIDTSNGSSLIIPLLDEQFDRISLFLTHYFVWLAD